MTRSRTARCRTGKSMGLWKRRRLRLRRTGCQTKSRDRIVRVVPCGTRPICSVLLPESFGGRWGKPPAPCAEPVRPSLPCPFGTHLACANGILQRPLLRSVLPNGSPERVIGVRYAIVSGILTTCPSCILTSPKANSASGADCPAERPNLAEIPGLANYPQEFSGDTEQTDGDDTPRTSLTRPFSGLPDNGSRRALPRGPPSFAKPRISATKR